MVVGGGCTGQLAGPGKLTQPSGDSYEGRFANGRREGKGIATFANGDRYEGDFRADKRWGVGTFTGTDGYAYAGDWVQGLMEGLGRGILRLRGRGEAGGEDQAGEGDTHGSSPDIGPA